MSVYGMFIVCNRKRSVSGGEKNITTSTPTVTQSSTPPPPQLEVSPPLAVTNPGSPGENMDSLSPSTQSNMAEGSSPSCTLADLKLDGIPEISDTSEEYLNFIALVTTQNNLILLIKLHLH